MRKILRRGAILTLVLVLVLSKTVGVRANEEEPDVIVSGYWDLLNAIETLEGGSIIGIEGDVLCARGTTIGVTGKTFTIKRMSPTASIQFTGGGFNSTVKNIYFDGNSSEVGGTTPFVQVNHNTTFENCRFYNCLNEMGDGGALYVGERDATLIDCKFYSNSANNGSHIYNASTWVLTIENCSFKDGWANEDGGAIYLSSSCFTYLTNCIITDNHSRTGGGIYNKGYLNVTNSIFFQNEAERQGADLANEGELVDNTTENQYNSWLNDYGLYYVGWIDDTNPTYGGAGSYLKLEVTDVDPNAPEETEPEGGDAGDSSVEDTAPDDGGSTEDGSSEDTEETDPPTSPSEEETQEPSGEENVDGENSGEEETPPADSGDDAETPPTEEENEPTDPADPSTPNDTESESSGNVDNSNNSQNDNSITDNSTTDNSVTDSSTTDNSTVDNSVTDNSTHAEDNSGSGNTTDNSQHTENSTSSSTVDNSSVVNNTDSSTHKEESSNTENSNNNSSTTYNYYTSPEATGGSQTATQPINVEPPPETQEIATQEATESTQNIKQNIHIDAEGVNVSYDYTEDGISISISQYTAPESTTEEIKVVEAVNASIMPEKALQEANNSPSWVEYVTMILLLLLVLGELGDKCKALKSKS